jgi:hypothetical protein
MIWGRNLREKEKFKKGKAQTKNKKTKKEEQEIKKAPQFRAAPHFPLVFQV